MAKVFTGAEFSKALAAGELRSPVVLDGMAKPAENDANAILFSPAGCESWVRVPIDLIESAEHLGESTCKDHTHPHVRIHLKEAVGKSPEGMILSAMLKVWNQAGVGGGDKPQPQPWRSASHFSSVGNRRGIIDQDCLDACEDSCQDIRGRIGFRQCLNRCQRVCRDG